jgi:phosphoglycerate kinase
VDNLIIGGGMGYTFIKAQGGKIGMSLHEDELIPDALEILKTAKEKGVNVSLSVETVAGQKFDNDTPQRIFPTHDIDPEWEGMDAAPASLENWKKIILSSKTILWNGPVGVFELPNFAKGTLQIAEDLAEATKNGAYTLVGGGDSVAAVTQMGYADKVSYVSTGGGAMLEAIEGKILPGIAAIQE